MASAGPRFTEGSTLRHVTVMSLTGSVGLSFMFLIDVATLFWVAQTGDPSAVAGVGIAWGIQFFTIAIGIGLAIAATALVARALGGRQRAEARRIAASSLVFGGVLMLAMGLAVVALRGPIVALTGAEPASAEVAERFLLISVPSLPLLGFGILGSSILRAEGDAVRAMMVTVSAGCVAMLLDPLFIFGLGLGVDGAAWVVNLSRGTTACLGLAFAIGRHDLVARPRAADVRRHARPFFGIAGPAILTQMSAPVGNFVATAMIARHGDAAVAGWAVVTRLSVFAFGGILALSGAISGIFGQNYGAGRLDRVRSAYRDALRFCAVYTLCAWALLAAASEPLIRLFAVPEAGAGVVRAFTLGTAGTFVFAGALFVANAAFNSLGRPFWSTGLNWLRDGLLVAPFCLALAAVWGAAGVVWGQALAGVLAGLLGAWIGWRFVNGGVKPLHAPVSGLAGVPAAPPSSAHTS